MFVLFIRPVVNAAQASVVDITFLNERSLSSIKTRPDTSGFGGNLLRGSPPLPSGCCGRPLLRGHRHYHLGNYTINNIHITPVLSTASFAVHRLKGAPVLRQQCVLASPTDVPLLAGSSRSVPLARDPGLEEVVPMHGYAQHLMPPLASMLSTTVVAMAAMAATMTAAAVAMMAAAATTTTVAVTMVTGWRRWR